MKTFKQFREEAVPINSAGAGNVPGIGIGPQGDAFKNVLAKMLRRKQNEPNVRKPT
jgi:hypothetical protein